VTVYSLEESLSAFIMAYFQVIVAVLITLAVSICSARFAFFGALDTSLSLITSADVRDSPHVAPSTCAVIVYITGLAFCGALDKSLSLIASTDVRDCPHVAPCTLAVIIGFARSAFCGLFI